VRHIRGVLFFDFLDEQAYNLTINQQSAFWALFDIKRKKWEN